VPEHADRYRGYRFPREVIAHAVRLYLRSALSFRDVEELRVGTWRALAGLHAP
jgi:transposase-like protein